MLVSGFVSRDKTKQSHVACFVDLETLVFVKCEKCDSAMDCGIQQMDAEKTCAAD